MTTVYKSLSIANPSPLGLSLKQKISSAVACVGLLILVAALMGVNIESKGFWLTVSMALISLGVIAFARFTYLSQSAGIKNNGIWFSSLTNRGLWAWLSGIVITGFYVALYYSPTVLGYNADGENTRLIALFDPLSQLLKGAPASQWFVYGTLYTLAILIFGVRFIWKYRHNKYQVWRTLSVMFFQFAFAFFLPEILQGLNYPYYDFKNMWPLNYYFFDEWSLKAMISSGTLGMVMLISGLLMIFLISPVLTYLYGKRWYCSWVCGCGGLAETAGDPFRHLSDKSLKAWKIERWLIHSVLVFVVVMTIGVLYSIFHNNGGGFWINKLGLAIIVTLILGGFIIVAQVNKKMFSTLSMKVKKIILGIAIVILALLWINYAIGGSEAFFISGQQLRKHYGFFIGATFSGVVGVGFYPLMGSRVWCRFGCPMAAILGIQQKFFSKFRITTNGGQCISCGNCSTYCEMGIDVRHYAQRGQDIVRASCVGCGICSAVCPRGVLKLENGSEDLYEKAIDIRTNHVTLDMYQ